MTDGYERACTHSYNACTGGLGIDACAQRPACCCAASLRGTKELDPRAGQRAHARMCAGAFVFLCGRPCPRRVCEAQRAQKEGEKEESARAPKQSFMISDQGSAQPSLSVLRSLSAIVCALKSFKSAWIFFTKLRVRLSAYLFMSRARACIFERS